MTKKFNRKNKEYQPTSGSQGPPTERICKPVKCEDSGSTPPSPPPTP